LINVTVYHRKNDPESLQVISFCQSLAERYPHNLVLIDVDENEDLKQRFGTEIPMVNIGPYLLRHPINLKDLEIALGAANDRVKRLEQSGDKNYQERVERGSRYSSTDRIVSWISRHYLALFNCILFLYVFLPFAAPVLMKEGLTEEARVIYTLYSPLCHQLAFRSFFLFGEQPYYPRNLAGVSSATTYEQIMGLNPVSNEKTDQFILDARNFLGNDTVGYKVAICERDIAMYGSIFLFGVVYALAGKKFKQIPWYIWLVIGVFPIALDGFSQLPSMIAGLPNFLPNRESTPFLRVVTGGLFGLMTAWFLYPLIEASMAETRSMFAYKKAVLTQSVRKD
jgi:uncharacterized membrane protein